MISEVTNEDNMAMMSRYPDKFFDLAIVDPEYGIGAGKMTMGKGKRKKFNQDKDWDSKPPEQSYFDELFRVSKNQIIWGGNYFIDKLSPTKHFLIWDKLNDGRDFADCEFAWSSLDTVARLFKMRPQNMDGGKIHPTQKPYKLYRWIMDQYCSIGCKILDTHLGSGSSRIAAYDLGFDFYGCELDKDYFDASCKRFNTHIAQQKLFAPTNTHAEQITLL